MSDLEFRDYVAANYDRFLAFLRGYVRPVQEAEDVLQEALILLLRHRTRIDTAAPGGYFFRTLRNAVVSSWRARRHDPRLPIPQEGVPDRRDKEETAGPGNQPGALAAAISQCTGHSDGPDDADIAAVEDACATALRYIRAQMTASQREVFAAYLRSGGSQSEAVALLDLPSPSSYPNALHRAKNLLRQVLSPHKEGLLRILGAVRLRELLFTVFCDAPEAPLSEEES
jgi:DNA-directed RNA polymerase specialized sigma24 family protein